VFGVLLVYAFGGLSAPEVDPSDFELTWDVPEMCLPDGRSTVAAYLGGDLPERGQASVLLRTAESGWVATITVADAAPRTLQADDCVTLAQAAALVVAVAFDPLRSAETVQTIEAVGVPFEPPSIQEPPTPSPVRRNSSEGARLQPDPVPASSDLPREIAHRMRIALGATYVPLPVVSGWLQVGYAAHLRPFRFESAVGYVTPRRIDDDVVGGSARIQAIVGTLSACAEPSFDRASIPLCVGADAGPVIAQGVDVALRRTRASIWVAAHASASAVIAVHPRLGIVLGAELLVSIRRPGFHLDMSPREFQTRRLGGRGFLGIEIELGRVK